MNQRWVNAVLVFCAGLAIGAGTLQIYYRFRENRATEIFERRLRCSELANRHAAGESTKEQSVSVERVGYSTALNSCVAYFEEWQQAGSHSYQEWTVIDLLSKEQFYSGRCSVERDCGNGKDIKLSQNAEAAFSKAVSGAKEAKTENGGVK
jgi:hypothetical protein